MKSSASKSTSACKAIKIQVPEAEPQISPELPIGEILDDPKHHRNWLFIHVKQTSESGAPEFGVIASEDPDYSTAERAAYTYFAGRPLEERNCIRVFPKTQQRQ